MSLRDQVLQTFDALNLLLVFLSVLFGIRYSEVIDCLTEEIPYGDNAIRRLRNRTRVIFWTGCVPVMVISIGASLLFLPLAFEVLSTCRFSPWYFDPIVSGFVFVEGISIGLALWMMFLSVQVIRKWCEINKRAAHSKHQRL